MKKYLFLFALAFMAAATACNKEGEKEDYGKKELTIKASVATTRAAATAEGITWSAGDALVVTCDGEAYNFTTTQSGATVEFTSADGLTQEMVGINPLTAFYGCTQFGAFTIPQNQTISGGASQTRLPMYAYTATAPEKGVVEMSFTPAASMLEVALAPINDVKLNKVELLPVDETQVAGNVAGGGTVNALTGKVTAIGNLKTVSAIFQEGASLKNGLTFRMPVGWFSVSGGMKLVLTYNDTKTYEELLWEEDFQSYAGSGETKSYKFIPVEVTMVIGARDFYVSPEGKASSKGLTAESPTTLDYALTSADDGSVIHLAAGTYKPERSLLGDESGDAAHKTFEVARELTLLGAGIDQTILDADGALHAVCVTAAADTKVVIKDLTIKGGDTTNSAADAVVASPVNGANYSDEYGSGLYAVGSVLELENVKITGNNGKNAVGGYLNGVKSFLTNVEVSGNTSTGNGCGLWVSGGQMTMDGCVFSGNNGAGVAAGLYIYAPKETQSINTITNCVFKQNVTTNNNSALYIRGADATADVHATLRTCKIEGNQANMGGGFGVTYADVLFESCTITDNTATGNGANLVYPGTSATFQNCIFSGNTAALASAIYEYTNTNDVRLDLIGCEFSGNTNSAGRGGAIYARAASAARATLNVINSTFFDNRCGHFGSAIAMNGTAASPVIANIVSSTITGNTTTSTVATRGGAVGLETAGLTANIYNSIISGNTWETTPASADVYVGHISAKANIYKSIVGAVTYDAVGVAVTDAASFVHSSMLTKKTATGKSTVFSLTGTDNPAKTYGYDLAGLKALGVPFHDVIIGQDQWGNARTGNAMGAYVGE